MYVTTRRIFYLGIDFVKLFVISEVLSSELLPSCTVYLNIGHVDWSFRAPAIRLRFTELSVLCFISLLLICDVSGKFRSSNI
jgi:hypothetical protein